MTISNEERVLVERAIIRLRARVLALVFCVVGGTGMFVATAWLVVQGGEQVGLHLGLLANYFPGYTVSWPGAFVGGGYGGALGLGVGYSIAWIYNRIAARADSPPTAAGE